jgi:AcrR family transcriptional regulator
MTSDPTADTAQLERPQRADARRNRVKVLEAAREVFGDHGLEAQVPDVARRAGVGVGTVYRHFPTKDALVAALAQEYFRSLADLAEEALAAGGDPWEAFAGYAREAAKRFEFNRGVAETCGGDPGTMPDIAAVEKARMAAAAEELMDRAKKAGAMRADATTLDIPTLLAGLGQVASLERRGAPVSSERYLTLMLDGLRAH